MTKIAEYKQIDTKKESYTVTIPAEYDDEGNVIAEAREGTRTREIPVMGMVYRDATPEELTAAKIMEQESKLQPTTAEINDEDKLRLLLDSLPVETPADVIAGDNGTELPPKVGYKWQPLYNGSAFGWELVPDPDAVGTADNPVIWVAGVRLIPNAYYLHDDVRYVYTGEIGRAGETWDETTMEEF